MKTRARSWVKSEASIQIFALLWQYHIELQQMLTIHLNNKNDRKTDHSKFLHYFMNQTTKRLIEKIIVRLINNRNSCLLPP